MEKAKKRAFWLNPLVILILLSSVVFAIAVPPASAAGVTVELTSASVAAGNTCTIEVWIKNVTNPGLGAYDFRVNFNNTKVRLDSVTGGTATGFTGNPTSGPSGFPGYVVFSAYQNTNPGPTGDLLVARLNFTGLAAGTTELTLTITALTDVSGNDIAAAYVLSSQITVSQPPVANFTASPTSGVYPLTVNFTNSSTGNIVSWAWDFNNDGTVDSTAQNPSHIYPVPGVYTVKLRVTNPAGTDDEIKTNYITVYGQLVAAFSGTPTTGNTGTLTVNFTDASTGSPTGWAWDFNNDGTMESTSKNPCYTYTSTGTYSVKLIVTNPAGSNSETKTNYIKVYALPNANFTATPVIGAAPLAVNFTDTSTGNIVSWAWDFNNDGTVDSIAQNPCYTYTVTGVYTVKLTATNPAGTDDEIKIDYIEISVIPVASFTSSVTTLTAPPYTVNFTDTSTGNLTSWVWDFGDPLSGANNASTLQNPGHTFSKPGRYAVKLTASNPGGSNTAAQTINVYGAPVPGFTLSYNPANRTITGGKVTTTLNASSSRGPVDRCVINWGDGSAETVVDYPATASGTHEYTTAGTYAITLKVVNPHTPEGVNSAPAIVNIYPSSQVSIQLRGPGDTDYLVLQPGGDVTGNIEVWAKNIPDAGSGSGMGAYDIRVDFDKTKVKINTVSGGQAPFNGTPQNNAPPDGNANTTGQLFINAYQTGSDPKGSFKLAVINLTALTPGIHNLALTINNVTMVNGNPLNVSPVSGMVVVQQSPTADFTAEPTILTTSPYTVNFRDASAGQPNSFSWDFGDPASGPGNTSNLQHPSHTFSGPGLYNISLTVNNLAGPANTIIKNKYVKIYAPPIASFTSPALGYAGAPVSFTDTSSGNVESWLWDFGDGSTSTLQNPKHAFTAEGTCTVALMVTNPAGSSSTGKTIQIVFGIKAVLKMTQYTDPVTRVVSLRVGLQRLRNPVTDETVTITGDGFSAFDMSLTYPAGNVEEPGIPSTTAGVVVRGGVAEPPFATLTINANTEGGTKILFNGYEAGASVQPGSDGQTPVYFSKIYPQLTGSKNVSSTIVLDAETLALESSASIPRDAAVSRSFKRGDARPDGTVNIADALYIAQYLAGLKQLGEGANEGNIGYVAPLNAACVKHDYIAGTVPGDAITITDALYIAQMLATLRDSNYNRIL